MSLFVVISFIHLLLVGLLFTRSENSISPSYPSLSPCRLNYNVEPRDVGTDFRAMAGGRLSASGSGGGGLLSSSGRGGPGTDRMTERDRIMDTSPPTPAGQERWMTTPSFSQVAMTPSTPSSSQMMSQNFSAQSPTPLTPTNSQMMSQNFSAHSPTPLTPTTGMNYMATPGTWTTSAPTPSAGVPPTPAPGGPATPHANLSSSSSNVNRNW